ncbi:MAG: hypothetical protein AAFV95_17795 [Bacteroidota bacterium]
MKYVDDYIKQFGDYLDGTLDAESSKRLERTIQADSVVREQWEAFQHISQSSLPKAGEQPDFIRQLSEVLHQKGQTFGQDELEAFCKGQLSQKNLAAFYHRMDTDSDFAEEVQLQQVIHDALAMAEEPKQPKVLVGHRRMFWRSLSVAAAILLMVFPARLVYEWTVRPSSAMADQLLEPEEYKLGIMLGLDTDSVRKPGEKSDMDSLTFQQAIRPYTEGDVEQAIRLLKQYKERNPRTYDARFFLAISQIQLISSKRDTSELSEAIDELELLLRNGKTHFIDEAEIFWYSSLAYLYRDACPYQSIKRLDDLLQLDCSEYEYDRSCKDYQKKAFKLRREMSWRLTCLTTKVTESTETTKKKSSTPSMRSSGK